MPEQPLTSPPLPTQPLPTGRAGLLQQLWTRLLVEPWDRIDARDKGQPRVGKVSARKAAIWTAVVASLMLTMLRFVVMDHEVQTLFGQGVVRLATALSPALGASLQPYQPLLVNLSWVVGCLTCYVAIPAVVVQQVFGLSLAETYLAPREYLKHLPVYALLFAPVGLLVLLVARAPEFQHQYPFFTSHVGPGAQIAWEIGYGLQFFALEFFFRGFILRGLAAEMGASAVLAMAIPYCMIHFGKPLPECLGSIIAGIVLGTLAMDTRSIWGGVTIHVAVAWLMDGAALLQKAKLAGVTGDS